MRKARFTEHQIIVVLKSVEAGRTVKDVCREAGLTGYTTAMTVAQTISLGGAGVGYVKRWVSMGRVHCAIFRSYRNGIQDESDERI